MKKYFLLAIVCTLIIPQVTFAAWWNPLTWNIFSFFSKEQRTEEVKNIPAPATIHSTTTVTTENKTIKNTSPKIPTPATTPIQVYQQPKQMGTLCNGTYWNSCPSGQNLVCPITGDAYCQVPQAPVQQKDNYQICRDSYGHATWDGSSYTSSGGPNCSCDTGYGPSADGTSCVAVQATQPVQQPDYSINNSACQTAISNLQKFQTSYANGQAGISGNPNYSADTQAGLGAIFANQYNTALPGYQMAAQAACKVPASNNSCQKLLQEFDTFQAQNVLSPNNISGRGQILGNQQAMKLGNYQTEIYYSCQ